ncbi:hypothetical protein G5I_06234 [Acromyrmex echinatior]|uniref:Uncharacterized protein n=1 Tax=Acromyrmex echinatior TaxID=103372 RepID=F4WKE7_ACREC|nr:hypothetical protein G5I_06234 [Acromyrmex echinatior]
MIRAHEAIGSLFAHPPTNINDHLPSLKALIRRDAATGSEATICPRNGNRNPAGPGNEIRVVPSTHWGPRASPSLGICFMHYAAPRVYATVVSQSEVQTSSTFVPEVITIVVAKVSLRALYPACGSTSGRTRGRKEKKYGCVSSRIQMHTLGSRCHINLVQVGVKTATVRILKPRGCSMFAVDNKVDLRDILVPHPHPCPL